MAEVEGVRLFSKAIKRKSRQHGTNLPLKRLRDDKAQSSDHPLPDGSSPAPKQDGASMQPATVTFKSLGLSDWLDKLCKSLGMTQPTEVQQGCIPSILNGRDVIGTAHTGSGKTAAFALPILQKLAVDPFGVYALVLTPTRELAFQLADQFRALGSGMSFKEVVIVGGLEMQQQAKALARRPHVVVATPGRLKDLLLTEPDLAAGFQHTQFLVMDEADRLLESSFESDLRAILTQLPAKRQTLLFSATMTKNLVALQTAVLNDAFHFQAYEGLQTAHKLKQEYVFLPAKLKEVYLTYLLEHLPDYKVRSVMIFVGTCKGCHLLSAVFEELGISAASLHSHKAQKRRLAALDKFKSGAVSVLLATDVASRGLDIPTVDLVVNFDLPTLARDYVHRVGRTARAGRPGWSLSLVSQYDIELVHTIEELTGQQLEQYSMPEKEVLKGITKVYTARRSASMRVAEEASRNDRNSKAR